VTRRMEQIAAATQRAATLTHQLLAFSRKQVLRPRRTNIADLVDVTSELMRRTLGEHIEVKGLLAGDLRFATVDPAQLELALVNICVNARDAMPGGGKLTIEARNVTLDDDYVARHPDAAAGEYVMLSVTDTGSGIPADALERVYEPFFTTKEVGQGTGLGLSMVDGFIRQSNGHLEIESEVGRGTAVKLYLPVGTQEEAMAAATPRTSPPRGAERILVVEDDEQVRSAVVQQLTALGYAVSEAADGSAGWAALKTGRSYALLLTDVVMPGPIDGRRLAADAVGLYPELRVLFMSGYEDQIANADVLDPRMTMLNKPFRKADLAIAVRAALDGLEDR
jgi:CheY-like chemotaxis protein